MFQWVWVEDWLTDIEAHLVGHLVITLEVDHLREQHEKVAAVGIVGEFSGEELGNSSGNCQTEEAQDTKSLVELGCECQELLNVRDVPAHRLAVVYCSYDPR